MTKFLLLSFFLVILLTVDGKMVLRIEGVKGFASNKTLAPDWEFYVKSYGPVKQTFNGRFNITRPVSNVQVSAKESETWKWFAEIYEILKIQVIVEHKTTTPYYTTIVNSTISACEFLNGTDLANPIAKIYYAAFAATVPPKYIHPCPYVGYLLIENVTMDVPDLGFQFLLGKYRTTNLFSDTIDDFIFKSITKAEFIDVPVRKRRPKG